MLHVLAHAIKHTRATTAGHRLKHVVCDQCNTEYWYFLSRFGAGEASSFIFSSDTAAAGRALEAARGNLVHRLDREAELVPCPHCHWISESLVSFARRRKYRFAWVISLVLLIAAGLAFFIVSTVAESNPRTPSNDPTILAWEVAGGFVAGAIAVFPIRSWLRSRINPNRNFPDPPSVAPGTPPAMLAVEDQSGDLRLDLVDIEYLSNWTSDKWAILRPGQLVFPPICCFCMNSTSEVYKPLLKVNEKSDGLPVPFCTACKRTFRPIWLLAALLTVAGACALGAAAFYIPGIDETGHWIVGTAIAFFGGLIGVFVVPNRLCRPFRHGMIDVDRGIMKFAARNEQFTQLLREQARELDVRLAASTKPG